MFWKDHHLILFCVDTESAPVDFVRNIFIYNENPPPTCQLFILNIIENVFSFLTAPLQSIFHFRSCTAGRELASSEVCKWALSEPCASQAEDEDHRVRSHGPDRTVSGQPGTAAGPHRHGHRQESGKTHHSSWSPQGNVATDVYVQSSRVQQRAKSHALSWL